MSQATFEGGERPSRITYISWAESCSRSDHTARELGGRSHMVYLPRFGSRATTILFKYLGQWRRTSRILREERPAAVFVMTPPLFAALPAFSYARRHGARVVLDAHTAAFLHPRWRWLQWPQRIMCRLAATTIVHNEHLARRVREAGAHATVVADVPIQYDRIEPLQRSGAPVVAVVCSFNSDEPLAAIWAAAARLPDVRFLVTGNTRHLPAALAARRPANLELTGFLSVAAYGGLLCGADLVMTLTTRDHTMLRGAYEAIYQGTPVLVSDWPILREAFPDGAVHVAADPAAIESGVRTILGSPARFREGAARLRATKLDQWRQTRRAIEARVFGTLRQQDAPTAALNETHS